MVDDDRECFVLMYYILRESQTPPDVAREIVIAELLDHGYEVRHCDYKRLLLPFLEPMDRTISSSIIRLKSNLINGLHVLKIH